MHVKISSAKWRSFCPEEDELIYPKGTDKIGRYQITTKHDEAQTTCIIFETYRSFPSLMEMIIHAPFHQAENVLNVYSLV